MLTFQPVRSVPFAGSSYQRTVEDEFTNGSTVSMLKAAPTLRDMTPSERFRVAGVGLDRLAKIAALRHDHGHTSTYPIARSILGHALHGLQRGDLDDAARQQGGQLLEKARVYDTGFKGRDAAAELVRDLAALVA